MSEQSKRPIKEANRINTLLDTGLDPNKRYPVNVEEVALELTPAFNSDPITHVEATNMGKVDGILAKHQTRSEWAVFYNETIAHEGRTNFTLAHELGHYFVHRSQQVSGRFECGESDILDKDLRYPDMEAEANVFAENLLMPNHDFRAQVDGEKFSFDLIEHCANRYGVSLTAATLKWLNFSATGAIVLLSEEGFMHWSTSNNRAFRAGKFFATKRNCIEIPNSSAASAQSYNAFARDGIRCAPGVWFPNDEVTEFSIYSAEYDKTLTVLTLESDSCYSFEKDKDDELLADLSGQINKF